MTSRPSKILIVNGKRSILTNLEKRLIELGFETTSSSTVRGGIASLKSDYAIDLVICDAFAPEGTGFNFLNNIKSSPKHMFLPFILTSTDCKVTMVQRAIELGACDVLNLPIETDDLDHRVKRAMTLGKPNILIIDHNELILGHLEFVAELEGFRPITATNVFEALDILRDRKIAVVLLDASMEDPPSLDIMVEIKGHDFDIPVILLTRHNQKNSSEKLLAIGADGILTKPFKNTEMASTIRHLLLRRKTTSSA